MSATPIAPLTPAPAFDPQQPLLVTGLRATAVGNGQGELALMRETRGGMVEWGGVYAEGIRLTGPWWLRLIGPWGESPLSSGTRSVTVSPHGAEILHEFPALTLRQTLVPVEEAAGVSAIGRRLEITSRADAPLSFRLEAGFEPFLAPVLIEGVKPYDYEVATRGPDLFVSSHGFGLTLTSDPLPHHLSLDRASWIGGRVRREVSEVWLDYDFTLAPGEAVTVSWLMAGGLERELPNATAAALPTLALAPQWSKRSRERYEAWVGTTPTLELPGEPEIESGYRLARAALRQLYKSAEPGLEALVAGYPWYTSFWGRDLAWSLPAVIWLGDFDRALASLRTIFRYQARKVLPILGATAGELPMQLTAGPIFLYGTSDTTLYYPDLLRRLVEHSGETRFLPEFGPGLERIGAWARSKTDPASGLLINGGEVAEIRSASDEAGAVHFGFDAVDTTIWDSTDRRDHAIDVQVLYVQMLEALGILAPLWSQDAAGPEITERAAGLRRALPALYDWPEEGYLYDSRTRSGRTVARIRPNALRMASAGLLAPEVARRVVLRASQPDLSTDWGLRTLSAKDPGFDPAAYHDGQVWPIATAWAADAALAVGLYDLGLEYLRRLARRMILEGGLANECYRGDRPEPFDSCFLLGFSVAPFLSVIFERLWGIRPRLREGTIALAPLLPADGPPARLRNLRLGAGGLDLELGGGRLVAVWRGPAPLRLEFAGTTTVLEPGVPASVAVSAAKPS